MIRNPRKIGPKDRKAVRLGGLARSDDRGDVPQGRDVNSLIQAVK